MEGIKIGRFLFLARTLTVLIAVVFAIGLMVKPVSAAIPVVPVNLIVSVTSTQALTISWSGGVADTSTWYIIATSSDNTTFTTTTQATTSASTYTASNLTPNTRYYFRVAAGNGVASSTFITTNAYTLALANTPTIGTPTVSTMPLTIDAGTNPAVTFYALYDSTLGNYLDYLNGAATTTDLYQTTSTWTALFAATGLTANSSHQFKVISRNAGLAYNTSTASTATFTKSNTPSSVVATVDSDSAITITWSGDSTDYTVENTTAGTNSGVVTSKSYTFSSLTCATTYSFSLTGRNGDALQTTSAVTVSAKTSGCTGGGGFIRGPATSAVPATPAVPGVSPAVLATPAISASIIVKSTEGEIIKVDAKDRPAVYYALNGVKYLFSNRGTYTTWSKDIGDDANKFATLKMVSQADFDAITTGGNLVAKPGSLIKFDNSPKIYGIATGGKLYEVSDLATQKALYGTVAPVVIQTGFRDGYYDHGNAVGSLTASSQKPE